MNFAILYGTLTHPAEAGEPSLLNWFLFTCPDVCLSLYGTVCIHLAPLNLVRYSAYEDPPLKSAVLDLATDLPLFWIFQVPTGVINPSLAVETYSDIIGWPLSYIVQICVVLLTFIV